jgi:hypothetical protein
VSLYRLAGTTAAYLPSARTTVQLYDTVTPSDGRRLIDTTIELGAGTAAGVTQPAWDQLELPGSAGTHRVQLTAGSFGTYGFDVDVVTGVDRIEGVRTDDEEVCFHVYQGDREVYGLDWTFTLDGQPRPGANYSVNCVSSFPVGAGALTGTALGLTATVELPAPE